MTAPLIADSANMRSRLAVQLYDEWRGYYMLQQLVCGVWCDVRRLSRDEATRYRCRPDEALELIWGQTCAATS